MDLLERAFSSRARSRLTQAEFSSVTPDLIAPRISSLSATSIRCRSNHRSPYTTRQINFAPSSDMSNEPSAANATPTGRPYTSFLVGAGTNPAKNGCGSPTGRPLRKETNTTWYPLRRRRFHEPCSAMKAPSQYGFGNCRLSPKANCRGATCAPNKASGRIILATRSGRGETRLSGCQSPYA